MAGTLRERRRQLLRDEILEATHLLMAEKGYAALSMEELAARVGISKPTLYSQFPTKEGLLATMATRLMERVFAIVEHSSGAGSSPLRRLVELLHTTVLLQLEQRTTAMQIWMPEVVQILENNPESRDYLLKVDRIVVDLVRAAIEAGEIDPDADIASIVRIFYALICSPNVGRLSITETPAPAAMADTVAALFWQGLRRDGGAR